MYKGAKLNINHLYTMKSSELRIGNYVQGTPFPHPIQ